MKKVQTLILAMFVAMFASSVSSFAEFMFAEPSVEAGFRWDMEESLTFSRDETPGRFGYQNIESGAGFGEFSPEVGLSAMLWGSDRFHVRFGLRYREQSVTATGAANSDPLGRDLSPVNIQYLGRENTDVQDIGVFLRLEPAEPGSHFFAEFGVHRSSYDISSVESTSVRLDGVGEVWRLTQKAEGEADGIGASIAIGGKKEDWFNLGRVYFDLNFALGWVKSQEIDFNTDNTLTSVSRNSTFVRGGPTGSETIIAGRSGTLDEDHFFARIYVNAKWGPGDD